MTRSQLDTFKKTLEARLAHFGRSTARRDEIAIQRAPDLLDEVQLAADRELVTRSLEREAKVLRDVRAALARMEEGAYGACVNCDEEIGMKRLNAIPWTALCIRCQEQFDSACLPDLEFNDFADAA